tara:strand:+ start:1853 stop:3451 length:1599 start_codon:yes stop_codon:yes gene_type:complete
MNSSSVNIQPGMGVYGYFKHINYKAWFALAEFIDNALQSFETKNGTFETRNSCLIKITYDPNDDFMSVEDNAFGISETEHERAFTAGVPPKDKSGLSEFGIGMKSAGLWFSPDWSVITQPIDSEKIFEYNLIESELKKGDGTLTPEIKTRNENQGFTRIELRNLHSQLRGKTIKKIKDHLSSIYRCFLRSNKLIIEFNGERLNYEDPEILVASPAWDKDSEKILWKKSISLKLSNESNIKGFVAIRDKGSTTKAGFSYFRRKRLIEGSDDEKKRPVEIFGSTNSFEYQRIFGEIHIDGFDVSHTKDSFNFLDYEEELNEKLKDFINDEPIKIIKQAREFRVKQLDEKSKIDLISATKEIASALSAENQSISSTVKDTPDQNSLLNRLSSAIKPNPDLAINSFESNTSETLNSNKEIDYESEKIFSYPIGGVDWNISVTMKPLNNEDLYSIKFLDKESENVKSKVKNLSIVINTSHDLILKNCTNSSDALYVTQILILAISTSEVIMTAQGHRFVGLLRQSINELISRIVSNN